MTNQWLKTSWTLLHPILTPIGELLLPKLCFMHQILLQVIKNKRWRSEIGSSFSMDPLATVSQNIKLLTRNNSLFIQKQRKLDVSKLFNSEIEDQITSVSCYIIRLYGVKLLDELLSISCSLVSKLILKANCQSLGCSFWNLHIAMYGTS